MSETLEILQDNLGKALWDTFFMVGVATLVGVVLGTALAVLLYLTQHRLFTPNHAVNEMVEIGRASCRERVSSPV